jgi:hypothetical protein
MLVYFNQDSTLCQWDNKAHMVCNYANQVFASVIFFGAFGTNNMFKLYPVLPWCFLIGALLGLAWVLAEKAMPHVRHSIQGRMNKTQFQSFHRYAWQPAASVFRCLNPAIALSGALNWAGNNNLTYATLGIYIAWFFQFYLKRPTPLGGESMHISCSQVSASASRFLASSSHWSSALVLGNTRPSVGGEMIYLKRVSIGSCTTTMPLSYLYRLRATLVSHRISILLNSPREY